MACGCVLALLFGRVESAISALIARAFLDWALVGFGFGGGGIGFLSICLTVALTLTGGKLQ